MAGTHPGFEYVHLISVQNAITAEQNSMSITTINELVDDKLIDSAAQKQCINLLSKANKEHSPLVAFCDFGQLGYSSRIKYFSVYTDFQSYYSHLKRVRVTYDSKLHSLSCLCKKSAKYDCIHEKVVRWYLKEHHPSLLEEMKKYKYLLDFIVIFFN